MRVKGFAVVHGFPPSFCALPPTMCFMNHVPIFVDFCHAKDIKLVFTNSLKKNFVFRMVIECWDPVDVQKPYAQYIFSVGW